MKSIKICILLAAIGLMSGSCSDFLDLENPSESSVGNYWNNQAEAEAMLAGCYSVLQEQGLYYNYYNGADPRALDGFGTTDGASGWWFWSPAEMALAWGNLAPSHELVEVVWNACYKGIARCNEVICYVPQMGADKIAPSAAERILAEAKFLRAFYYNYLTSLYRDVPLSLEPTTTGYIPVSKKADVVKYITDELKAVAESDALPERISADERGRVSKGAAWALLSRIYLYNEMWTEAAEAANKVIDLNVYNLEPDYLKLFSEAGNTSPEIIFAVRFSATADGNDNNMRGFLSTRNNDEYYTPIGVTQSLLNEYYDKDGNPVEQSTYSNLTDPTMRDPRWGYCFTGIQEDWVSEDWINWTQVLTGKINKYQDYTVTEKFYDDQDYYVIRYADVLLMRAEALANSGGAASEIEGLINQVRDRQSVSMPHVTAQEVTYHGSLLNLIKHERRVEFAFEGLRYFDLKRWGETSALQETNYIGAEKARVWPIPQSELDNNKYLVQAPEWGGE